MKLARRLSQVSASATVGMMQRAMELRRQGFDIIDLGPGQPDFPTPARVKEAGIRAISEDFTNYTPSGGIAELRDAVAASYNRRWDTSFTGKNVLITCGAKHAVYNLCQAVFEEGQEVLVPVPYWVTFPEVVKLAGALPIEFPTSEKNRFILRPDDLPGRLTERTRGLILNTPNNPTGAVIPAESMAEIVKLARNRKLFILSDETYEHFTYGEAEHTSLAALLGPEEGEYAIVSSLSKTYSMTGWRIGYILGPRDLITGIDEFQSHETGNPSSISQKAALEALASGTEAFAPMRREYESRLAFVLERLGKIPGFRCPPPSGAFYVFPNVQRAMARAGTRTSEEFANLLLEEAEVATVPGSAFGLDGFLRISYATSRSHLREGLDRIQRLMEKRS